MGAVVYFNKCSGAAPPMLVEINPKCRNTKALIHGCNIKKIMCVGAFWIDFNLHLCNYHDSRLLTLSIILPEHVRIVFSV